MEPKPSVLVTGGAGFIGSHLVEGLVKTGWRVSIVDNLSTGSLHNLNSVISAIELYKLDILGEAFQRLIEAKHFDYIIHLAANSYVPPSVKYPVFDFDENLRGTFLLLNALRNYSTKSRLIYASSAAVYGDPAINPITESSPLDPISPYGVSKLGAERYAYVFHKLYGVPVTILRFFSVYGPRQMKQLIYDMMRKMDSNPQRVEILGDGKQTRDVLFVEELVSAIFLVLTKSEFKGEVFNIASGVGYPIINIIQIIADKMNVSPTYVYTGSVRAGDPIDWVADIQKIRSIGFSPRYSLEEGIEKTVSWFRNEKEQKSLTE
jgi:UDP-glucose 4-epimerase